MRLGIIMTDNGPHYFVEGFKLKRGMSNVDVSIKFSELV